MLVTINQVKGFKIVKTNCHLLTEDKFDLDGRWMQAEFHTASHQLISKCSINATRCKHLTGECQPVATK